jgi:hypothetical protein
VRRRDGVTLGGGLVRACAEPVLDQLQPAMGKVAQFPAAIRRARFGADFVLVGAGAVVLRLTARQ